jgi:hypothetical protein
MYFVDVEQGDCTFIVTPDGLHFAERDMGLEPATSSWGSSANLNDHEVFHGGFWPAPATSDITKVFRGHLANDHRFAGGHSTRPSLAAVAGVRGRHMPNVSECRVRIEARDVQQEKGNVGRGSSCAQES